MIYLIGSIRRAYPLPIVWEYSVTLILGPHRKLRIISDLEITGKIFIPLNNIRLTKMS